MILVLIIFVVLFIGCSEYRPEADREEINWKYNNGTIGAITGYKGSEKIYEYVFRKSCLKESEAYYKNGKPHGKWTWWYEDGSRSRVQEFKYGKCLTERNWEYKSAKPIYIY